MLSVRVFPRPATTAYDLPDLANAAGPCGHTQHLRFPAFNKTTATTRAWSAADSLGRIKVEIVAGVLKQHGDVKSLDVVEKIICFSFVHAPLGECEHH